MTDVAGQTPFRAEPKFRSAGRRAAASSFTDRTEFLGAFDIAVQTLGGTDPRVMSFHGFGGIGKSTLLRELVRRADRDAGIATVDFASAPLRHHEAALYVLRKQFAEAGAKFHHFDIAYATYWQRMHPHIPLSEKSLPLIGESEILSGILDGVGSVPMVGLVVNLAKAADKLVHVGERAYRVFQDPDLKALDELPPAELLDALTFFFARDLCEATAENKRFVGVFDTYEALWHGVTTVGDGLSRDSWIRDLASQTPGMLWLIAGREEVRWADVDAQWQPPYLVGHRLDVFGDEDAVTFLRAGGIESADLLDRLARASRGVPFYLSVALDHFQGLRARNEDTSLDEFGSSHPEILDRFLGHLSHAERELLKLLAVARYWDRELFEALAVRFNVGVALTEFDEFCSYSFNRQRREGEWTMHDLMRDELVTRLSPALLREVHSFISDHYKQRVDESGSFSVERLRYFEEALWHAVRGDGIDGRWVAETGDDFIRSGSWGPLEAIVKAFVEESDRLPKPARAALDLQRASLRLRRGVQGEAIELLTELRADPDQPWLANVTLELAHARRQAGQPREAADLIAVVNEGGLEGFRLDRVALEARLWLADHLYYTGDLQDAWELLKQTEEDPNAKEQDRASVERFRGHILRMVERRDEALTHYQRAQALSTSAGSSFAIVEAEVGLIETLAVLDPEQAIAISDEVIERAEALGSNIEKGKLFTALGLARLLLGDPEVAKAATDESAKILNRAGYQSGVLRARMVNSVIAAAEGKRDAAAAEARDVIANFTSRGMYPMLAYLLSFLLEALELGTSADEARARASAIEIQWMDSQMETAQRYRSLIDRCLTTLPVA